MMDPLSTDILIFRTGLPYKYLPAYLLHIKLSIRKSGMFATGFLQISSRRGPVLLLTKLLIIKRIRTYNYKCPGGSYP